MTMEDFEFKLQNIRFDGEGGITKKQYTFSIASVFGKTEVALLCESDFVPVVEWFGGQHHPQDESVMQINSLRMFSYACESAGRYITNH